MKKIFFIMAVSGFMAACNNTSESTVEQKLDSLEKRKDTLTERVDSTFNAAIDSMKERKKELKDKFDSSIDAKKDSLKGKKQ